MAAPSIGYATGPIQTLDRVAMDSVVNERIVEIPQMAVARQTIQEIEKRVAVPQIQTIEKIVEIPQMQTVERLCPVPQMQYAEVIQSIPVPIPEPFQRMI